MPLIGLDMWHTYAMGNLLLSYMILGAQHDKDLEQLGLQSGRAGVSCVPTKGICFSWFGGKHGVGGSAWHVFRH